MFYGTVSSYIEFPNKGGLDTQFSITLMCWVAPRGQNGPIFSYGISTEWGVLMWMGPILMIHIAERSSFKQLASIRTREVLPVGKWVHVAGSYDHSSGKNSLYINGHLNFKGKIAEMKVYDVALNEAQIQTSIRQGNCTSPVIVVSFPSPMIPLIIETPVIA